MLCIVLCIRLLSLLVICVNLFDMMVNLWFDWLVCVVMIWVLKDMMCVCLVISLMLFMMVVSCCLVSVVWWWVRFL